MTTEVKKLDSTKVEIHIEETGESIKKKFEETYKQIGEKAKVPGFRPGHVPRDMLEKHFSADAHQHVANELIPELYHQAVEQEKLEALDVPQILDVKLDQASISFKAQVEVMPEISLKQYKGLKIAYEKPKVTADEIKRNIDSLKEKRKADGIDDGFAKVLGYPNVAELESAIEKQLFIQKENQQRQKTEQQVLEQLGKGLNFKLPQSMVEKQLQDLLRRAKVELAMRGVTKEQVQEQEKKLLEELEPQAKKQVEVYLILATIAKKENIPLEDHMPGQVMELLFKEADWQVS
jgi:FKBP-type peptidyl-prolyl cis-trans isomerase (trigger factor)